MYSNNYGYAGIDMGIEVDMDDFDIPILSNLDNISFRKPMPIWLNNIIWVIIYVLILLVFLFIVIKVFKFIITGVSLIIHKVKPSKELSLLVGDLGIMDTALYTYHGDLHQAVSTEQNHHCLLCNKLIDHYHTKIRKW